MLRVWQYLCRPTRWRLWEGCRAGRERKNSVRRGQGFLYVGPVRNNAHARRYFSAAKGFWGSDEKKEIRVRSSHRVHDLLWCLSSQEPAVEKEKKSDASRLAVPLQTHQMATVGRMPSRTREEKLRQEGSGLPVWRTRPAQCACEEVLLCCKGFLGLGYKKKKSALVAATGCMTYCGVCLHSSLRWKKKKSDASRLAVPLQTHQMATVGRMPSRTREEKLRQEGLGLPVWRTRPEQCACEEVLLCCKGFLGLGYKKKKSALVAATGCMTYCGVCLHSCLRWKKKKRCFEAGSTPADPPDGDCGKDAEQDERGRTPSGGVRASCMEDPS
ncbi:uncharacterized protein LOC133493502 [Syngnathoides biaculeatus]|uniref:uncharacterized protein LOC133493502 n=1 Tax=Syngnathoides biaculeatus TaxID=300417 RepID=UPI002ADDDC9D|nr:uncharacterized protein LOC133493502 [Syngnathoides biaculeatus]